ncbi:hypothetical protein FF011L_37700 [Roseimaritima multifibrata]|uniref:Uncharacterized protein n=1 Tax=Roseimaritima multifibrata TaxID=1930274 RepID=A0A517MJA7_9BACT|nr:hypothetical protein [Roseimaritima multifibrata]QDS94986.1 hypothetical protein FF011L_37700 [Roseimaritima multifibrata]
MRTVLISDFRFSLLPPCGLAVLADFKVGRCTRKCYAENRPLKPGETFYSVVLETEEGDLERRDYSANAWTEPPPETIGWWKGKIPEAGKAKLVLAPNAVLVDLLRQLVANDDRVELAYLLALLLMRRRVVRPLDPPSAAVHDPNDSEEASAVEQVVLTVEVLADGQTIDVTECEIQPKNVAPLRDALNELLYCEAE